MPPSWARNAPLVARSAAFTESRPFLSMWTGGGSGTVLVAVSAGDVLVWLSGSFTLAAFVQSKSAYCHLNGVGCASAAEHVGLCLNPRNRLVCRVYVFPDMMQTRRLDKGSTRPETPISVSPVELLALALGEICDRSSEEADPACRTRATTGRALRVREHLRCKHSPTQPGATRFSGKCDSRGSGHPGLALRPAAW